MNKEVLLALRTNFDRPEHMKEWAKRLQRKFSEKLKAAIVLLFILHFDLIRG